MLTLTGIVVLVILVLVRLAVARWGWRLLRGNEKSVAGGSMSEQAIGRLRARQDDGATVYRRRDRLRGR